MSTLGPRTALKSRKISGSLAYILAQTNVKQGTKAATNDVAGCTLEMGADGKWVGTLGSLSEATADALYASGALANLATGATYRDTSGIQYTYGGAVVGWVDMAGIGIVYDGTTVPFPIASADKIGKRIAVINPAVLRGFSWLECNGHDWVPGNGEIIAGFWGNNITPLVDVTPGVLSQLVIYSSPIIPSYMFPASMKAVINIQGGVSNSTGAPNSALAMCLTGGVPTTELATAAYAFPAFVAVTPNSNLAGFPPNDQNYQIGMNAERTNLYHAAGGSGKWLRNQCYPIYNPASTRAYIVAKPSHVNDRILIDGFRIVSIGAV